MVVCSFSRPDEEGITTRSRRRPAPSDRVLAHALMRKGLRPRPEPIPFSILRSCSRPDEEGITTHFFGWCRNRCCSCSRPDEEGITTLADNTVDETYSVLAHALMRKGL